MKVLILTAALVSVAVGQTVCNDPRFQACSAGLAGVLGVSNINLFNDYVVLQNALQNMFTQNIGDITGLVTACNALHQFYLCLGQDNLQLCLGVNGLITKGRTPAQAYGIDGLLIQYQFMCGAGFYTAQYNNLACLQRVTLNFNSTLRECLQTYQTNILHDPANACTYASQELSCYQAPFRAQCPPDQNIAGWWSCETQRNWILSQFFTCPMQCNFVTSAGKFDARTSRLINLLPTKAEEQYFLDHHKEEDGTHKFKMPDVFEQDANGEWSLKEGKWMTG